MLLVCMLLLIAVPVLAAAFESHTVNVRMDLSAPVQLSASTFELTGDDPATALSVALTQTFRDQVRLDRLDYRVIATIEPADPSVATGVLPAVVLVRDPDETDTAPDRADSASLGTRPDDPSDSWFVALEPTTGRASAESGAGAPPVETPEESVDASGTPSTDASGTRSADASGTPSADASDTPLAVAPAPDISASARWIVRVSVEVIGYHAADEVAP